MIVLYRNQAEESLTDVGYNDYAQLFDIYPLIFHGKFQEKNVSEVPLRVIPMKKEG